MGEMSLLAARRLSSSVRHVCEHMFVRWDNTEIDADDATRGCRAIAEDAVVRRFDAPEALDTRFHEVRAKSAHQPRAGRRRGCRSSGR